MYHFIDLYIELIKYLNPIAKQLKKLSNRPIYYNEKILILMSNFFMIFLFTNSNSHSSNLILVLSFN